MTVDFRRCVSAAVRAKLRLAEASRPWPVTWTRQHDAEALLGVALHPAVGAGLLTECSAQGKTAVGRAER
jgi:hypothetical protein